MNEIRIKVYDEIPFFLAVGYVNSVIATGMKDKKTIFKTCFGLVAVSYYDKRKTTFFKVYLVKE